MDRQVLLNEIGREYLSLCAERVNPQIKAYIDAFLACLSTNSIKLSYNDVNAILGLYGVSKITSEEAQRILGIGRREFDALRLPVTWYSGGFNRLDILILKYDSYDK